MFDISWGEMLVVGAVALIVIGPKDLPGALRALGQATGKIRRMAGEFRAQFDEALREAEFDQIKKQVDEVNQAATSATSTAFNPIDTIRNEIKGAMEPPPAAETGGNPAAPSEPPVALGTAEFEPLDIEPPKPQPPAPEPPKPQPITPPDPAPKPITPTDPVPAPVSDPVPAPPSPEPSPVPAPTPPTSPMPDKGAPA